MINDLWYKNALIYCLSVGTFLDSNGDGVGDFSGLMRRLDYLQGLGVTALWRMPFQRSPGRDDGYEVADYYSVDPRYGTLGDFVEFTHAAKQRGIAGQRAHGGFVNLLSEDHSRADRNGRHRLLIEGYGYRWYRVGGLDYLLKRAEVDTPSRGDRLQRGVILPGSSCARSESRTPFKLSASSTQIAWRRCAAPKVLV